MAGQPTQRKINKLNNNLKKLIDELISLGQQTAAAWYAANSFYTYGHRPITEVIDNNQALIESHSQFQILPANYNLPPPPILDKGFTFQGGKDFLQPILKAILGPRPGYGYASRKPIWWPGEFKKINGKGCTITKTEIKAIIVALYRHYGIEVEMGPLQPAHNGIDHIQYNDTRSDLMDVDLLDILGIQEEAIPLELADNDANLANSASDEIASNQMDDVPGTIASNEVEHVHGLDDEQGVLITADTPVFQIHEILAMSFDESNHNLNDPTNSIPWTTTDGPLGPVALSVPSELSMDLNTTLADTRTITPLSLVPIVLSMDLNTTVPDTRTTLPVLSQKELMKKRQHKHDK